MGETLSLRLSTRHTSSQGRLKAKSNLPQGRTENSTELRLPLRARAKILSPDWGLILPPVASRQQASPWYTWVYGSKRLPLRKIHTCSGCIGLSAALRMLDSFFPIMPPNFTNNRPLFNTSQFFT
jgi:hypothetical protein